MRVLATICVAGYALFLLGGLVARVRGGRAHSNRMRSAGGMFGQYGSVWGQRRSLGPIGLSIWFLLGACALLLWAFWWHK